jgi:hypothetical protein
MFIKMLVFKCNDALLKFLRNTIRSRKPPLTIASDFGSQQIPFFTFNNGGIRFVEKRSWQTKIIANQQQQNQNGFDFVLKDFGFGFMEEEFEHGTKL